MRIWKGLFLLSLMAFLTLILISFISEEKKNNFTEIVKIALRDSGNKLLLSNRDSTSLILPILEVEKDRFELAFENKLTIHPDSLVTTIDDSFKKSDLPKNYIVEVIDCNSKEVAYSYQIKKNMENNIIPCIGRYLPLNCYKINVLFTYEESSMGSYIKYSLLSFSFIGLFGFVFYYQKEKRKVPKDIEKESFTSMGTYKFYKNQNKLIKGNREIKLTSKECELIKIFSENQNQVVRRDVLEKKVWEDNGVFVGRSLDTFISKIRKKFRDDDSINIINVHGVGYKLEVV